MPTRARMEGEAMAGKMVEEVLVLEGEMAELVVRLVGVKVPAPQLEAGTLLTNPEVVELLGQAGEVAAGCLPLLARLRNKVQELIITSEPDVWHHDEAEEEGWSPEEWREGRGGPPTPGDALKVVVELTKAAEGALAKVVTMAVDYHITRVNMSTDLCPDPEGRDDQLLAVGLLDHGVRGKVVATIQAVQADLVMLAGVFGDYREEMEEPRTNWEDFLYS